MTSKLNLALIGYGEVGQIFAREFLAGDGAAVATTYDILRSGGGAGTDGERVQGRRAPGKARRRAAEVREAAMTLDDLDLDGSLSRAVAEAQQCGAAAKQDKKS